VRLRLIQAGSEIILEGTHLLVAVGRVPNTKDIGLELAGIELTDAGYIKVNERLETTAPGVWAVGECAGSPQFTHIAFDDFRIVRDSLGGGDRVTTGRQAPFCVFTDPELARIGLSEKGGQTKRNRVSPGQDSNGVGVTHPNSFRDARVYESADRYEERPYPWIHGVRSRRGRNNGPCSNRHGCRTSLHSIA
jgi:hypothetical protein